MKKSILFSLSCMLLILLLTFSIAKSFEVRQPVFAGSWYPENKGPLRKLVDFYLQNSEDLELGNVRAIIVPHAGYEYSGQVAADSFVQINKDYDNVFVLGPSHQHPFKGVSIIPNQYSTPLGKIESSDKIQDLLQEEIISEIPEAHRQEHSIEVELPFLQRKLNDLDLIPMIVGEIDPEELKNILIKNLGEEDLIIVSVDLSHYNNYSTALNLDSSSVDSILNLEDQEIFNAEIDAPWAVSSLLKIAKEKNWKPYFISYANSGDITRDTTSVVGYSAIVFVEKSSLTSNQEFLLELSRKTLETYYNENKVLEISKKEVPRKLRKNQACFVTLNNQEGLRGCIGDLSAEKPIYQCVIENSINAAINDARFSPVAKEELGDIKIDINLLTKPSKLKNENPQETLNKVKQYKHGVILKQGSHQSTYLPTVWDLISNKISFLENLCVKGNMNKDCWQSPLTEIYVYESEDFKED